MLNSDARCAALLAKELAKLKISSRLTEQESDDKGTGKVSSPARTVKANMFVEDAVSAQGPIVIEVNPSITVAELKVQVEKEFEIPVDVQKWILGKQLVGEEDTTTLESQGVNADGDQIYLYLVNPEEKKPDDRVPSPAPATAPTQKVPLLLPTEPNQKGRYWNYEMERWSFCNSDDDEDRAEEIKQINNENKTEKEAAGEEAEEEWEYYYDDVDLKPKEPVVAPVAEAEPEAPVQPQLQPGLLRGREVVRRTDGWECPVCTLVNPLERPGCMACTAERPADLGAAAPEDNVAEEKPKEEKKTSLESYKQLENLDIIPNAETFECTICYLDIEPGDGVMLRECLHTFCK